MTCTLFGSESDSDSVPHGIDSDSLLRDDTDGYLGMQTLNGPLHVGVSPHSCL